MGSPTTVFQPHTVYKGARGDEYAAQSHFFWLLHYLIFEHMSLGWAIFRLGNATTQTTPSSMSSSPCGTLGTPAMYSLYMRARNLSCGWVHSPQLFCHIRPSRISHIEDGPARADVHFPQKDLFHLDDIGENWTIRDGRVSIIHSSKLLEKHKEDICRPDNRPLFNFSILS